MFDYAEVVRSRRAKLEMTREVLAEKADVSTRTIRNIEYGENITMDSFLRVIRALNLKLTVKEK